MNTEIGREIKKKNFIRIRIYLNDVQSTIACIKDTRSKYIYIYVEQINERIVRGSYDLMVK